MNSTELDKIMRRFVTVNFREFCLNKYPGLQDKLKYRKFFQYLCFSSYYDDDTNRLIISAPVLWNIIRTDPTEEYDKYTFHAEGFLKEFQRNVLPNFRWTNANPHGKARQVFNFGFDDEMNLQLDHEIFTFADVKRSKEFCHFITGLPYYPPAQRKVREQAKEDYLLIRKAFSLNATQTKILTYLDALNGDNLLIRKWRQNKDLVEQAISEIKEKHIQVIQYRIRDAVLETPQIYYRPSSNERTPRLSACRDTIIGLKSPIRKAWCKGWTECDLKSSQFAILASKLKAPLSSAFIASGHNIWEALYLHTHGIQGSPPVDVKKKYKRLLYSICFGKPLIHKQGYYNMCKIKRRKAEDDLMTEARTVELPTFLEHPIIKELITLRDIWHAQIKQNGGEYDIWNRFIPTTVDRWVGSVAGEIIQGIELEIIAPIFDVANKTGVSNAFQICLFQHDGATISFNDKTKKERVMKQMQEAIETRAKELGVMTSLEFTDL